MSPTLHLIVPAGFDDPARPSGGNIYDQRVAAGLSALGWEVRVTAAPGRWPRPDAAAFTVLERALTSVPSGELVLVDGLIASPAARVLVPQAHRLALVVLMHMPLVPAAGKAGVPDAEVAESAVLGAAAGVVTTSVWTREQLLTHYRLPADLVRVAPPGTDPAPIATGSLTTGSLLCVATMAPHKGHDLLFAALAQVRTRRWHCVCAGSLQEDPGFRAHLHRQLGLLGVTDRIDLAGVLTGAALDRAYAQADVLLVPSRSETYGMVVTEALARGLPVLAADVGGLPEALGRAPDGSLPGRLVPPGDPDALAAALRSWFEDPQERDRQRAAALARRPTLCGWDRTASDIAAALLRFGRVPAS